MRNLKKFVALSLVAGMTLLAGCGSKVPENTVNSVNDLPGKTIGVQLGTTGENVDRSNGTLTMATNAAFEPYEYYEGNEIVGIDADMAQALCDKLGYELKIEDMEFDSIINAVQSGKADMGVAGMTVTEDRLKNIDFSDPYTTATQVIIVRK